ncbi:hypothetical protein [Dokdonella immobilis]|uniref:Glyoxalase-like domain-containing protein n=1 Tax=Dokdonella immobilis TaxID=578942 RepID=A0A1I4VHU4_9GAMM|nr:hypothetical protein [Dokdonella immobilis]SFN00700.1 hypothetical protein SAMN05216289_102100 [Dokdonella immobilis]
MLDHDFPAVSDPMRAVAFHTAAIADAADAFHRPGPDYDPGRCAVQVRDPHGGMCGIRLQAPATRP